MFPHCVYLLSQEDNCHWCQGLWIPVSNMSGADQNTSRRCPSLPSFLPGQSADRLDGKADQRNYPKLFHSYQPGDTVYYLKIIEYFIIFNLPSNLLQSTTTYNSALQMYFEIFLLLIMEVVERCTSGQYKYFLFIPLDRAAYFLSIL